MVDEGPRIRRVSVSLFQEQDPRLPLAWTSLLRKDPFPFSSARRRVPHGQPLSQAPGGAGPQPWVPRPVPKCSGQRPPELRSGTELGQRSGAAILRAEGPQPVSHPPLGAAATCQVGRGRRQGWGTGTGGPSRRWPRAGACACMHVCLHARTWACTCACMGVYVLHIHGGSGVWGARRGGRPGVPPALRGEL